ncbi:MAG: fibronectin type III domain-containing protein, partial [Chloroflexota bacterium]|nr:fibronectin type III domain-containing protein [Chloroflexota bacterium]
MKRNIDIVPLLRPSRRPTVRPALRLAVALAVVVAFMALLVEQPASAQTTVTLVSNTGQTDGGAGSLHLDHAQAFTTGNNSAGYKLTGIDLKLEDTNDSTTTIEITIHESSSDLPGTSLGTLTKSGSLADNAVNSWTTSTGIDLAASTTYFMVVNGEGNTHTNDGNVQNTASDSQDSGGASGWSISDTSLFKALAATTWSSWHQSKMIAVKGYAKTSTNTAPGAPTGLTAFATGQTQINLSWTAPSSNGGAAISGYKIEVSTDGTTWTDLSADTGSTTTTYSHSGLTAGSTRHYRVSAINSIGTGTASGTAMETANVLVGNAFQSGGYFRNAHALPHAQAFTTGAEGAYLLTGIDVVSVDPQGDDFTVNIHATSGGLPTGSSLATLTAPSGTGAFSAGRIRFTAPDNTLLDPNTTYTVVVARDGTGDVRISASLSDNEDAGKASGFSIANTSAFYSGVAWALDNMNSLALQIAVRGEATSYTPTNVKIAPGNGQRMTMYWDAGDPSNLPDRFLVMYGSGGFNWCYTGQSNCPTQTHGTLNYNDGAGESSSGRAGYKSFSPADAESGSAFGYEAEFPFTSGTTIDANRGLAYNRVCGVKGDGTSASHYHCSSFLPNVTSRQNYDLSWSSLVRNTGTGTIAASWTGTGRHNRIVLLFKSGTQSYPEIADDFSATADVMVGGKPVAGYRVLSGSATSYTFGPSDALDASIDYTFTLRPYASASHLVMNDSAERSATDVTPPGAPTGLAAQATGQTRIHLSWTAPTQAGSTAISGYRIEVSTDGSAWTDLVADTGSTDTTYADTGLTAGSTRHYRVSAINSAGTGTVSGTATETADVLVGNVFQGSDGSATLANQSISTAFTTGSHTQGYTVTAIEVISEDADGDDFLASIYNTNDSGQPTNSRGSLIVSGADFNAARIRLGVRERHQTLAANTTYAVVLLRNGTENVTLDTTASDDEDAGKASGFSIADVSISGMVGGSWSNLANSEAVRIAVRGEARTGNPPGKPTALAGGAPGVTQINLSWTAPTDAGTTAITGYRIEVSTDGSTWTDLVADTGSTAITYAHTELTAGSTRHYRVSAINDFGAGAASDTATETSNVLVGNALQSATTGITVTTLSYSQGFTTGGNSGGYTLNAIEVVSADTEGDDFTADLYATSSGLPTGSSLASLTAPTGAGAFSAGRVRFTAPANTTLTANTTYAVVVARDGSGNVDLATLASDDEDAGKASGFSIANQYGSLVGNWAFFDVDPSLHIAVRGEAKTGNNAPVFSDTTVTRSFDENTAAGEDVGAAVE